MAKSGAKGACPNPSQFAGSGMGKQGQYPPHQKPTVPKK